MTRRLDALAALVAVAAVSFLACSDDPLDQAIPQTGGTSTTTSPDDVVALTAPTTAPTTTTTTTEVVVPATAAPATSAELPEPTTTAPPPTVAAASTTIPAWAQGVAGAERVPAILWAIAACEGAIHPHIHDPWTEQNHSGPNGEAESTASGPWQDLDGTWGGYGGYSRAMYAPPSVQIGFNVALYERRGTAPWRASRGCWG